MTSFGIATISLPDGAGAALVVDGALYALPGAPSVLDLLQDWDAALARLDERLERGDFGQAMALDEAELLPPVPNPPNLYMAGANYADHYREMHGLGEEESVPRHPSGPFVFLKPTTCLIANGEDVVIGAGVGRLDWEVELAVVIGRSAHRVSESQALDHVAAYTILNDVSARDHFVRRYAEEPFTHDWFGQKAWATSAPAGPWLLPARDCPDPSALALSLRVNDSVMQDSSTAQMIFSIEELIAYISRVVPLVPGDIIATGTCGGVGAARGRFLAPGDVMYAEIEGIGVLENPVVAP
jgi:2-keto-4-pentenoate hydratase/2-oxohepta-3-ene-1,7-dioic acid hydratase in catechol pathway